MPLIAPSEENSILLKIVLWISGGFVSFLGGVITTTWMLANKVKDFDDRLKSVEQSQIKCQGQTLVNIDKKLDKIHDQILDLYKGGK